MKVRRSFPLTSVESIKEDGPLVFKLVFRTTVMVLEASSPEEATDWVRKIRDGGLHGTARSGWD